MSIKHQWWTGKFNAVIWKSFIMIQSWAVKCRLSPWNILHYSRLSTSTSWQQGSHIYKDIIAFNCTLSKSLTENVLVVQNWKDSTGLRVLGALNEIFPKQNIFLSILSFQQLCLNLSQRLQEAFHYETTSPTGIGREELTNLTQSSLSGKLISRLALL